MEIGEGTERERESGLGRRRRFYNLHVYFFPPLLAFLRGIHQM